MHLIKSAVSQFLQGKVFLQFLASQGISNFGDSFRFIALTMLLLKLTGSGMSTSIGLIFSILPCIILSPLAGTVGDMCRPKYLMSFLDMLRGIIILLFPFCVSASQVFALMIVLSAIEAFYSPLRRKIVVNLSGRGSLLRANSLLTGLSGIVYLLGPLAAGILTDQYGPSPGFFIGGFASIVSSFLLLAMKVKPDIKNAIQAKQYIGMKIADTGNSFFSDMWKGFKYVRNDKKLMQLAVTGTVAAMCTVSMNIAFYPYSFDILSLGAKGWSFLISIYYGTNLLAAYLLYTPFQFIQRKPWHAIYICLGLTSIIWLMYSMIHSYLLVLLLQFIEGTILAVSGILMTTLLQGCAKNSYVARASGVSDVMGNAGRIVGMAGTYLVLYSASYNIVFIACSAILLLFVLFQATKLQ